MKFTLKGKAKQLPPRWEEGFKDGYEYILNEKPCPFGYWGSVGDGYGNGYAEGMLTGRSEMMTKLCLDHWPPFRDFELN